MQLGWIAMAVAAAAAVAAPRPHAASRQTAMDRFAERLDALRRAHDIPGLAAAVVEDGRVVLLRGFGVADVARGTPVTPRTPFDIASVTKPLSAVVALALAERGTLDLDRPMAAYSGWADFCAGFSRQPSIFARGLKCEPAVHTLRHLLTHTAVGTPGTAFSYNPVLYSWASRPMMAAAGEPFSTLVTRLVLEPAGMSRSARRYRDLPLPPTIADALAPPHGLDDDGRLVLAPPLDPQGDGAAGGVVSTVEDLARFDVALEDGRLIPRRAVETMMTAARTSDGAAIPYGLGWYVQPHEGETLVWHSGWWEKAYSALYLKVPARRLTLILLANSEGVWWNNPLDRAQVHRSPFAAAFLEAFPRREP